MIFHIFYSTSSTLYVPMFILLILIFLAYLIGSFSLSNIIGKKKGIDLKNEGSKNLGTSNTIALIGVKEGILVCLSDGFKATIAMLLPLFLCYYSDALFLSPELLNSATVSCNNLDLLAMFAAASIIGHIFPIHLNFDGGKGFATYVGTILTLSLLYPSLLLIVIAALIFAFITDYIVMATFAVIALTPLYFIFIVLNPTAAVGYTIVSIIMLVKHIDNIKRIKNGTEMRIKAAFKKEYRK